MDEALVTVFAGDDFEPDIRLRVRHVLRGRLVLPAARIAINASPYLFASRIITSIILNRSFALRAWGLFAGMMSISPARTA